MAFKVLFLAHSPDAEPEKHQALIETGKYKLFVQVVRNQEQAIAVCKKLFMEEGIHSVLLCPGFTHQQVAEIFQALEKLKEKALSNDNLMPYILDAVKTYASIGEICDALREVFGEYQEVVGF